MNARDIISKTSKWYVVVENPDLLTDKIISALDEAGYTIEKQEEILNLFQRAKKAEAEVDELKKENLKLADRIANLGWALEAERNR